MDLNTLNVSLANYAAAKQQYAALKPIHPTINHNALLLVKNYLACGMTVQARQTAQTALDTILEHIDEVEEYEFE